MESLETTETLVFLYRTSPTAGIPSGNRILIGYGLDFIRPVRPVKSVLISIGQVFTLGIGRPWQGPTECLRVTRQICGDTSA